MCFIFLFYTCLGEFFFFYTCLGNSFLFIFTSLRYTQHAFAYPHSSWYEFLLGETGISHALVEYGMGKTQIQQSGIRW